MQKSKTLNKSFLDQELEKQKAQDNNAMNGNGTNSNSNWDPITNSSATDSPLSNMDNPLTGNNSELEDFVPDELPSVASHSSRLTSMDLQEDSIENCLNLPKTVRF